MLVSFRHKLMVVRTSPDYLFEKAEPGRSRGRAKELTPLCVLHNVHRIEGKNENSRWSGSCWANTRSWDRWVDGSLSGTRTVPVTRNAIPLQIFVPPSSPFNGNP
jgi:hypothetical protein